MTARHAAPTSRRAPARREWARGAGALLVLLTLVVGIPAVLIAVTGVPFGHGLPSTSRLWGRLRQPDDGQLLLDALLTVAWLGWAAFTTAVTAETVALARGSVAPALLGLTALQPVAGRLLASVALLLPASTVLQLAAGAGHPVPPATAPLHPTSLAATRPGTPSHTATAEARRGGAAPPASVIGSPPPVTMVNALLQVYVVGTDATGQRDTLWSIAERHLGNALRWRDIANLNEGRRQVDGSVFTDPNLIRPGWTLQLPADATGLPRPAAKPPAATAPAAGPPPMPSAPTPAPVSRPSLPPVPAPIIAPPDPTPANTHTPHRSAPERPPAVVPRPSVAAAAPAYEPSPDTSADKPSASTSIPLGTGSEISAALATAVLASLALRRLRRRHHYQPRNPRPAQLSGHAPPPPTLQQLLASGLPQPETPQSPESFFAAVTARCSWHLGTRGDQPATIVWTDYPVLHLTGNGAADVARAIITAAVIEQPGTVDVLTVSRIFTELLPGCESPAGVRQLPGLSAAAQQIQLEVISRSRRLANTDLPDAAAYRTANPEDPFPALLLIAHGPLDTHPSLAALLADNAHLDIAALILVSPHPEVTTAHDDMTIEVAADGTLDEVSPAAPADRLTGTRLYRLTTGDAAVLLAAGLPEEDDDGDAAIVSRPVPDIAVADVPGSDVDWTASSAVVPDGQQPPIRVQLLGNGPMRIWVNDVEVNKGLRESGRQLLAWFLLHPQGRTIDAAVTALWPNTTPERVSQRFWTAFGSLRSRLADPDGTHPGGAGSDGVKRVVLSKIAGAYQPEPGQFDVDLWTFQAALQRAADAADDAARIAALRTAIDTYQGPFAADADYLWADPIREELHHHALDAHVAYAEIVAGLGGTDQAIATLDHARQLDPYAEDIYRRLMRLHHDAGRTESALQLWKQLNTWLADLDVEPDPETSRLYRRIRGLDNRRQPPHQPPSQS